MTDQDGRFRVAYVLLRPPSYSETFIGSEIRAVGDAGAAVEVFVARPGGRAGELRRVLAILLRHPVRLLRHVRLLGFSYLPRAVLASAYAIALSRDVARFRPDVVHTHFVNLPTATAVLVGRELGVPVTALAHAADFLLDGNVAALARRLGALAHLFVISEAAVGQLRDKGVAIPPPSHSVVRAAYDGEVSERAERLPGTPARLVTVARLIEKKGIGATLDAVARLSAEGLPVRYDVYGDGPLREALTAQAQALGIAGMVTFHGAVPHREATAALLDADVAVLACQAAADGDLDGIPVFLMEAASRGVPVVTTAVSGIPELVGARGAWLAPPADPVALATALRAALEADPVEVRRRTREVADRIRTEFPPGLQAERLLDRWRRLAGAERASEARSTWD
ncbi:glycosyltransferase [Phytohabitans kaempferiae]|uniref:Glycosyltransferase n=1 Tax=Phytohabitans kaempferiae TaxID=1620943 RepID=A0ABV6MEU7_9ACTN